MIKIKKLEKKPMKVITYSVLTYQGYLGIMDYFNNYHEFEKLENIKVKLRQEITDLELSVGDTEIVTLLRATLATVYNRQEQ